MVIFESDRGSTAGAVEREKGSPQDERSNIY